MKFKSILVVSALLCSTSLFAASLSIGPDGNLAAAAPKVAAKSAVSGEQQTLRSLVTDKSRTIVFGSSPEVTSAVMGKLRAAAKPLTPADTLAITDDNVVAASANRYMFVLIPNAAKDAASKVAVLDLTKLENLNGVATITDEEESVKLSNAPAGAAFNLATPPR